MRARAFLRWFVDDDFRGRRVGCSETAPTRICEHLFVMYSDALLLLFELADTEDERFQQAAARWHARFVLEGDCRCGRPRE